MNMITILIVWVGSHNIDAGVMQVGDMMAFIQYSLITNIPTSDSRVTKFSLSTSFCTFLNLGIAKLNKTKIIIYLNQVQLC